MKNFINICPNFGTDTRSLELWDDIPQLLFALIISKSSKYYENSIGHSILNSLFYILFR